MEHSYEEKLSIVSEILSGKRLMMVCRERGIDKHMLQGWLDRYERYGEEGLRKVKKCRQFTQSEKEEIVLRHIKEGLTLRQLSLRYDVSRSTIISWTRQSRTGDVGHKEKQPGGSAKVHMGRPKKKEPQSELEKLQAENLRLRAENALLKKVKALVEEQEARARLNGRKPSMD